MEFYNNSIFWIDIEKIKPNPFQPRREFDEARLKDLASSIRQYGILQPLVVTRNEVFREDGSMFVEYELISGERRLRASKIAGLPQVPAIIRTGEQTDRVKLELAIIENLQREDLNPIDRAKSFKQLVDTFNLKHTEIAEKIGKSREYVSNSLRLLQMPEEMQDALVEGKISEGHTRPIMMLNGRPEEQMVLFREIMQRRMTVREAEGIARRIAYDKVRKKEYIFSPDIIEMESKLTEALGTRVQIEAMNAGGKIHIDYFSEKDLRNILDFIKKSFDGKVSVSSDVQTAPQVVGDAMTSPDNVSPAPTTTQTDVAPNIPASTEIGIAGYDVAPLAHLMDTDVSTEEQRVLQDDMPKEDKKDDEELYDMNNFTV